MYCCEHGGIHESTLQHQEEEKRSTIKRCCPQQRQMQKHKDKRSKHTKMRDAHIERQKKHTQK
jgi:hypothetical protein